MRRVVIATRRSRLALWQAEHVKQRLEALHGGLAVELLPLSTRGDEILDRRLDQAGGKGLFVKELENALAERRADLAVHSMKDVPADLPPGFVLAAIMAREDPRDAFISNNHENIGGMKAGSVVGTSSLRRAAQIAQRHPHLEMKLLRGNVETRLAKLDRGEYDAIILAVAGLVRLGLAARIRSRLDVDDSLPAPGQGALGIECLDGRGDVASLLGPLNDPATARCVQAERAVSRALGGSCAVPLGAYAELADAGLRLRALVASLDGQRIARADCRGTDPAALAADAVAELRRHGAVEILSALGT
ncbi:MAG TPA: hydroxymethylbilane synthase [Burkholderiales bacterium]|jgi:hydroxymethylbilane synthase|nr:hydroxymethylbilane synthase [Burkholderiales bacterium]